MPVCQTLCQNFGVLTDADRKTIGGNRTRRRRADVQRPVNVNILGASIIYRRHMMPLAIHYVAIALQIPLTQAAGAETELESCCIPSRQTPGRIAFGQYRRPTQVTRINGIHLNPHFYSNRIRQDIECGRARNRNVITPIEQKSLPNFPICIKKRADGDPVIGSNIVIGITLAFPPVDHARRGRIARWRWIDRQDCIRTNH